MSCCSDPVEGVSGGSSLSLCPCAALHTLPVLGSVLPMLHPRRAAGVSGAAALPAESCFPLSPAFGTGSALRGTGIHPAPGQPGDTALSEG